MCSSLNLNSTHFGWTNPYWVIWCGETRLLVSWCVGGKCDMAGNDEDQAQVDYSVAGRSGGWMMPCAILIVHVEETRSAGFSDWASKPVATVWWFVPQNHCDSFLVCVSKPRGGGLLVCVSKLMSRWRQCENTRRHLTACFIVNQVGLGFFSFASKLTEERGRMVHVTSRRLRGSETKDGRFDGVGCGATKVRPNCPSLAVNFFSAYRNFLVFYCTYK
jgi:hypothetical protein